MPRVKLLAKLPKDDTGLNGLDEGFGEFVKRPKVPQLAVVQLVTDEIKTRPRSGNAQTVDVEIIQIEVISLDDADMARQLLERQERRRNGRNPDQLDLDTMKIEH